MGKKAGKGNPDPLAPARSRADWDAQGWASESEPVTVAPRLEATLSIRFDPDGALLLRRAARIKGMTKSEFVRQATLQEARKTIAENPLPVSMWISGSQTKLAETRSHSATEGALTSREQRTSFTTTRSARKLMAS